ncbi:MAG: sulfotransferase [Paracoccaceae bacterium]
MTSGKNMSAASTSGVMFFGIGAQKAGTTWLFDYLSGHPDVSTGPLKEYHFFDHFHPLHATTGDRPALLSLRRRVALARVLRRATPGLGWMRAFRLAGGGVAAFRRTVRGDKPGARAFGDITPGYSLLGRSAFAEMAACHDDVRFLFVMRDPVERLWSQLRMRAKKKNIPLDMAEPRFAALVAALSHDKAYFGRSDYRRTINEMEAAVSPARIHYMFYETMFSDAEISVLTDFLGIEFVPADHDRVVHGGRRLEMPEDWRNEMQQHFCDVYDFVAQKFGDRVPVSWPSGAGKGNDSPGRTARGERERATATGDATATRSARPAPREHGNSARVALRDRIHPAHRARAIAMLKPQYEFADHFFGGDLPEVWHASNAEVN